MEQITTLAEAQKAHQNAVNDNQNAGVIDYNSGEAKSDQIHEVVEGYKYLPGKEPGDPMQVLGPGSRFHPTVRQVEKGSLRGKSRELTRDEYARHGMSVGGKDIGIRALNMSNSVASFALKNGLTEEDFASVAGAGTNGQYTMTQVKEMVEAKARVS